MSRRITSGPRLRVSRNGGGTVKYVPLNFLSLTQRLNFLSRHIFRSTRLPTSERYHALAEECRFQAKRSRDPKAQIQMLCSAAFYDRKAVQAEKCGD
jgi:hypothetical protein